MTDTGHTMSAATLEALRGSIAKWEQRASGRYLSAGPDNCPLCQLFNRIQQELEGTACDGCPVKERTGQKYCHDTPMENYSGVTTPEARIEVAQAEVAFLKSLLPTDARSDEKDVAP